MRTMNRSRILVHLMVVAIWACGGDSATDVQSVAQIDVDQASLSLTVGQMATITATARDGDGNALQRTITFMSNNESVVTVTSTGVVTAKAPGSTSITVAADGKSTQVSVSVAAIPVASVEVDPTELDLLVGEEEALTVTLKDAGDNTLTGRVVDFESDDESVATVNGQGIVTAESIGSTTVTVSSEGQMAEVDVQVTAPVFAPTEDTEIDGDRVYQSISIPAGVTVTVTDGSVIHSLGEVDIEGSLMADCYEVNLIADGPVTVTGTVDNRCTTNPTDDGDQLRIVGTGAMTFTGTTGSSGDLTITNDSTLTLEDFEAAQAFGVPVRAFGSSVPAPCNYNGMDSRNRPKPPTPSTQGKTGANGRNGKARRFICDGDSDYDGGEYEGYDAGDGEDGDADATNESQGPAEGGDGGDADETRILATGSITFRGGVTIRLGNGGKGGDATRVAPPNRSAEATGGAGGKSGTLTVRSGGGISIPQNGGLIIDIGKPGDGGDANAAGGKGDDSTPTEPAKKGGNGTATGGAGGDTPDARFRSSGNVIGINNITLTGGPAGLGGTATAVGGQGGHGVVKENPDGAEGGAQTATGGKGGEAPAGDFSGMPFVVAGDGGDADLSGGMGGNGFNGCMEMPPTRGGNGGDGGDGNATGGDGGTEGVTSGTGGEAIIATATGDGGDGNDGVGPGNGGSGGAQAAADGASPAPEAIEDNDPNYEDGADGKLCIPVNEDPIVGEHTVTVTACPTLIGMITIMNPYDEPITVSVSPGHFAIETVPPGGIGIPAGGSFTFDVYFNCMTQSGFQTAIQVFGETADGFEIIPVTIPVTMNIHPPPGE